MKYVSEEGKHADLSAHGQILGGVMVAALGGAGFYFGTS